MIRTQGSSSTRKHSHLQIQKKFRSLMSWSSAFSSFNSEARRAIFDPDIKIQSWGDFETFRKLMFLKITLYHSFRLCRARRRTVKFKLFVRARHKRELNIRLVSRTSTFQKLKSSQLWALISESNIAHFASRLKLLNTLDQLIKLLIFFESCTSGCLRVLLQALTTQQK